MVCEPLSMNLIHILVNFRLTILSCCITFVRCLIPLPSFAALDAGIWDPRAWTVTSLILFFFCWAFIQFKFTCRLKYHLKLIEKQYFLMPAHAIAWFSIMSGKGINRTNISCGDIDSLTVTPADMAEIYCYGTERCQVHG